MTKSSNSQDNNSAMIVGNWVGHIFMSIEDTSLQSYLLKRARKLLKNKDITFHSKHDLHISLSKPFNITLPCIDGFISLLRARIKSSSTVRLIIDTSKLN